MSQMRKRNEEREDQGTFFRLQMPGLWAGDRQEKRRDNRREAGSPGQRIAGSAENKEEEKDHAVYIGYRDIPG